MLETLSFVYEEDSNNVFKEVSINTEDIYNKMQDKISKEIFTNRILFSMTGDAVYMRSMISQSNTGKMFIEKLLEVAKICEKENRDIYIYGAGVRGKRFADMFPEIKWKGIIDRKPQALEYNNIPIWGFDIIEKQHQEAYFLISNYENHLEIKKDLMEKGISEEKLIVSREYDELLINDMYFDEVVTEDYIYDDAYLVDGGGYDAFNTLTYIEKYFKGKEYLAKAAIFEPDFENAKVCQKRCEAFKNIEVYQLGLSDVETVKFFSSGLKEGSNYGDSGESLVKTKKMDDVLSDKKIGFIKLDVEGYEENAIKGAEKIIREQEPVIAVSIYHKRSDIYRIPKLILELNPNYVFYMRHYLVSYGETVLYALPSK